MVVDPLDINCDNSWTLLFVPKVEDCASSGGVEEEMVKGV